LAHLAPTLFWLGVHIGVYREGFSPTRDFNSSLLTVLYLLNTFMVLWPLAAMILKKSCPWSRQLLIAVCLRSWKVKSSIAAFFLASSNAR